MPQIGSFDLKLYAIESGISLLHWLGLLKIFLSQLILLLRLFNRLRWTVGLLRNWKCPTVYIIAFVVSANSTSRHIYNRGRNIVSGQFLRGCNFREIQILNQLTWSTYLQIVLSRCQALICACQHGPRMTHFHRSPSWLCFAKLPSRMLHHSPASRLLFTS